MVIYRFKDKDMYYSIYQRIKDIVSMNAVAEHYGYEINRQGFIKCPFHNENTASCKLYESSFYCFGCGAGGDVITFVAKLYRIKNSQAALRINADFNLCLSDRKPSSAERSTILKKQAEEKAKQEAEKRELERYREEYIHKCEEAELIRSLPYPQTEEEGGIYAQHLARLAYLEYWFSENFWR